MRATIHLHQGRRTQSRAKQIIVFFVSLLPLVFSPAGLWAMGSSPHASQDPATGAVVSRRMFLRSGTDTQSDLDQLKKTMEDLDRWLPKMGSSDSSTTETSVARDIVYNDLGMLIAHARSMQDQIYPKVDGRLDVNIAAAVTNARSTEDAKRYCEKAMQLPQFEKSPPAQAEIQCQLCILSVLDGNNDVAFSHFVKGLHSVIEVDALMTRGDEYVRKIHNGDFVIGVFYFWGLPDLLNRYQYAWRLLEKEAGIKEPDLFSAYHKKWPDEDPTFLQFIYRFSLKGSKPAKTFEGYR